MNRVYTISELPRHYFGGEYTIFSFDVLNGVVPLALHIGTSIDDIITISDLDKLNGYFEGEDFYEDKRSYNLFVEFLDSIILRPYSVSMPMHHDIEYAKEHFYVDLRMS